MTGAAPLPRSTPEAEGIHSPAILDFVTEADARLDSLHSFMLLRHGRVVAEAWWQPYAPDKPHSMYSVSKSFTAIAVGLAIDDGLLALDDLVIDHLPADAPVATPANLATLSIRHLLSMTTGHTVDVVFAIDPAAADTWAAAMMAYPAEFEPGGSFGYNSAASYLLSAIVQQSTGQRMLDYLESRVLHPIGIVGAEWEMSPQGIDVGGWGLAITTEDLARFAQLCLQRGEWNGQQLVPAAWIDEATRAHVDTSQADHKLDGRQGYGYHFWRNSGAGYRADGAFGQFGIVLPDQDAVIAITAGVQESQDILDLVWQHLLPAFRPDALPADPADHAALTGKLGSLVLPTVVGTAGSPTGERLWGIRWEFDDPEVSGATLQPDSITLEIGGNLQSFAIGHGEWAITEAARVAASGAWIEADVFRVKVCRYETPFVQAYTFAFDEDRVTLTIDTNVKFDENEPPKVLVGQPLFSNQLPD